MLWEVLKEQGWEAISEDDKYGMETRQQSDGTMHALIVRNVQANDYRQYRCMGQNVGGSCSDTIELFGSYI